MALDNDHHHLMAWFAFGMAFMWNRGYLACQHGVPSTASAGRAGSVRMLFSLQTLWKMASVMEQVAALMQWVQTRFHAWRVWGTSGAIPEGRREGDRQRHESLARLALERMFAPSLRAEAGFAEYHPRRRSEHSEALVGGGISRGRLLSMDQVFVDLLAFIRMICPCPDFSTEFEEELRPAGRGLRNRP